MGKGGGCLLKSLMQHFRQVQGAVFVKAQESDFTANGNIFYGYWIVTGSLLSRLSEISEQIVSWHGSVKPSLFDV